MKSPREELQNDIREILARQDLLRKELENLNRRVELLRSKAASFTPEPLPEPGPPPLPEFVSVQAKGPLIAPEVSEPATLPVLAPVEKKDREPAAEFGTGPIVPPPVPVIPSISPSREQKRPSVQPAPVAPVSGLEKRSLEVKFGSYWLVRIGVAMFLAALVFAGNYAYENLIVRMGPGPKVGLLYLAGGVLTGLGMWLERRGGKLLNFAQVLFAGGLSAIYYITYAAHYVPRLQIITNPIVAGILLLVWAGVMAWIADRSKSQTLAVLSVLLAYFTSSITPIAGFTLFSNLLLTAVAVFFFVRHRWAVISWVGLAGTYASFGYWRVMGLVERGGFEAGPESPWLLLAVLAGYWIVFTAATFSTPGREAGGVQKITFLTANNSAFLGYGCLLLLGHDFLKFWQWSMGLGALLLGLSAWAKRLAPTDRSIQNSYFAQGLLLVTVGLIGYFEGQSLALVLAMESAFLLVSGTLGKNLISKLGAYATAAGAVFLQSRLLVAEPVAGALGSAAISLLLLFNAWWVRRSLEGEAQSRDDIRSWILCLGALGIGLLASWVHVDATYRPLFLAVESVVLAAVFFRLRLREAVLLAQGFWLAAMAAWLALGWDDHHRVNTVSHLAVLLTGLVWGHGWKWLPLGRGGVTAGCFQAMYALGAVMVLAGWILPDRSNEEGVVLTAVLALGLLVYGVLTRAWFLAGFGQIFLWISAAVSLSLDRHEPWNWAVALVPIAGLVAVRRGVPRLLAPGGINTGVVATLLTWLGRMYEVIAFVLGWVWLARFVPDDWRVAAYLFSGFVLFLAGTWSPAPARSFEDRLLLFFAGWLTLLGWGFFVFDGLPSWQNLIALLLVPFTEIMARRKQTLADFVMLGLVVAGVVGLLLFVTRFTAVHLSSNYWTVSWGLLAGLIFAAGFLLKHPWYRWAGLILLVLAIGRVGVVDIWRFETIYRILSLFVLSGMAIGLGFLYTKYQEKMKEWL